MLRRVRRPAALAASLVLLSGLAACGSDDGDGAAEGLDAVTVSGEVGSAPEVTWEGEMDADGLESETLVEGEGPELESGDQVLVNYWVGNGFTEEEAMSSYGAKLAGSVLTIGEPIQAQQIGDIVPAFLAEQVEEGATVGTRLAFAADAPKAFGETNVAYLAEFGIGNEDPVVVVADLVGTPLEGPEGKKQPAPAWAPRIVAKKGEPASLDFSGTPAPSDQLRTAVLVEGEGEKVAKGDILVADYLGQVYQGKQPFDESFSGEPASFPIGLGAVVKGWDQALVGVPVGSRVLLQIPPKLGYGKQGQPQAGIKGTDTLYFVVDVLGAA